MDRVRPQRVQALTGIGVDKMGHIADQAQETTGEAWLRMENLDVDVPPDPIVKKITAEAAATDDDNSYLPFIGQLGLRNTAAAHVSAMTGNKISYTGKKNCIISAGGLSGILNTLLATIEVGDGVLVTDPCYSGLINRVKLSGGVPVFAPLEFHAGDFWKLNREAFQKSLENPPVKITAMLFMSPSLPSGVWFDESDWTFIAKLCVAHNLILILDTAMERLIFDKRQVIHPASLSGMEERTITVGSASKELRMIGWRVGWIVGPEQVITDVGLVGMANVVVPVGIAQRAAQAALERSPKDISQFVQELENRRNVCMRELKGLPVGVPAGGWSFVLRVRDLGWTGRDAAQALLQFGVCTTPMDGWGEEHGAQYIRFVFSNEPIDRLQGLGQKIRNALKFSNN